MNSEALLPSDPTGAGRRDEAVLLPLPLEDPERYPRYWMRMWLTLKLAFTRPMEFFERVPQGNSVRSPLGFALLLSTPFYLFLCIYPAMFALMALLARLSGQGQSSQEPPFHWISMGCLGGILLLPLLQIAGMLFWGLIQHFFLRIWGVHAPEIPIEQDSRACIYAHGFLVLSFLTPLGPLAALAVVIVAGMGFAKMHRVPAWRGVAATLTPGLLVLIGLISLPLLLLITSHPRSPKASYGPSSVGPIPSVAQGMALDEATEVHVDQARIFLNNFAHEKLSPEETITAVLKSPTFAYPSATNPYGGLESPFRQGFPTAIGEVGFIPIRESLAPTANPGFRTGVLIIGRKKDGEFRRFIQLEGPSFRSIPDVPLEYRRTGLGR